MTLQNASQFPKTYFCRHMQPGTVGYDNGTVLVDTDAIKRMLPSGIGKPVYVGHIDDQVDLKTLTEKAEGYVTESFYNELDGWAWFKFLVVGDKGHDAIRKGWSVSNAHLPTQWGPGGTKNNIPYKREVINSDFEHLAIVSDPRYEGSCIMTPEEFKAYQEANRKKLDALQNSKEKKPMFKMFKNKKEEVTADNADLDTVLELETGESATLGECIALIKNSKNKEKTFDVDGVEMTAKEIAEAAAKLKNAKSKKNEKAETPDNGEEDVEGDDDSKDDEIGTDKKKNMKKNKMKKNESDDDENCKNSDDDDDADDADMKKNKMKKNSKTDDIEVEVSDEFFDRLKNAHLNPKNKEKAPVVYTSLDQIERGKQRYGSGK